MATPRERVVEWLRDAHAAEEQAHTMLSRTAHQVEGHPQFRQGLEQHADLSKGQALRLKDCLEELDESTSAVKTFTGQVTAFAQTMSGYVVGDEPVKAVLATSTFAQMEVSSYRILVAAAVAARLDEVAGLCRSLLEEETAFARWLEQQTDVVTREYLLVQKGEA
jgi:ferritin-like metal-binding protein YciE